MCQGVPDLQIEQRGIDVHVFGEMLMSSGIVLNDDIYWITFHRCDRAGGQAFPGGPAVQVHQAGRGVWQGHQGGGGVPIRSCPHPPSS
jgi:hypothetical protein